MTQGVVFFIANNRSTSVQTRSPSTFKGFVPIYSLLFDLSNHVIWPSSMCQPESVSNIYFTSTGAVLCYMVKIICTIYRAHIYTHTYVCHCFPLSVCMCITVPQSWGVENRTIILFFIGCIYPDTTTENKHIYTKL